MARRAEESFAQDAGSLGMIIGPAFGMLWGCRCDAPFGNISLFGFSPKL
jgi:hypothetical protein